jgi:uncharacterized protein YgbK (DUF1537 family)
VAGAGRERARPLEALLSGMPPAWPQPLLGRIRREARDRTLVVLDDDPTGTQTVRGVLVLIEPSVADLAKALDAHPAVLFILTNSRSLPSERAVALARRLGTRIRAAARRTGRSVSVVSRSDSTLRGHFPAEVDALAAAFGVPDAPVLLMPYLGEAGRVTVGDVHYLVRDGAAVPVADTEFARDPAFGYRESNLREWVVARLGPGDARPILSLSLDAIRSGGPDAVARALREAAPRAVVIANAADDRDAETIAAGVLEAEAERPILARTAAGYVRARAGQPRQPVLERAELRHGGGPGVVIVGSHVPTTTRQLDALIADPPVAVEHIEVPVARLAATRRNDRILRATVARAGSALDRGAVPIVATSRELVSPSDDDPTGLRLARRVSRTLATVVRALEPKPAWIVAKGGITSSDVAAYGLGARQAAVVGPLLPGVPVWRIRRAGGRSVLLVVFPGNVGDADSLRRAVDILAAAPDVSSGG